MKVVTPKTEGNRNTPEVLLPLVSQPKAHTKTDSSSFELKTDPTDANSPKFSVTILRPQGGEDIRTCVQWITDCKKVIDHR